MRRPAAVLALVLVLDGCSLARVRVPHRADADRQLDCTSSSPMADTVGAAFMLGIAAATVVGFATSGPRDEFGAGLAMIFLGPPFAIGGIIYTASAIYGHRAISRCKRFERQRVEQAQAIETEAWALAKRATQSARKNDCAQAQLLAIEVKARSTQIYDVLMYEDAVARCLNSAPAQPLDSAPDASTSDAARPVESQPVMPVPVESQPLPE